MVDRFDAELLRFEQSVREGTARVKVTRNGGGGSLDWLACGLLAVAVVVPVAGRRRTQC